MLITTKAMNNSYVDVAPTLTENTAEAVTTKTTTVKKTPEASTSNKFTITTKQMVLAVVGTALAAGAAAWACDAYLAKNNFSHLSSTDTAINFSAFDKKVKVIINDNETLNTDNEKETENIKGNIIITINDEIPIGNNSNLNELLHVINHTIRNKINEIQDHIKNNKKKHNEADTKNQETNQDTQ